MQQKMQNIYTCCPKCHQPAIQNRMYLTIGGNSDTDPCKIMLPKQERSNNYRELPVFQGIKTQTPPVTCKEATLELRWSEINNLSNLAQGISLGMVLWTWIGLTYDSIQFWRRFFKHKVHV